MNAYDRKGWRLKIWVRRVAIGATYAVWTGIAGYMLIAEVIMAAFMPNLLLQLLLPVVLFVLSIAAWRVILALRRWAPDQPAAVSMPVEAALAQTALPPNDAHGRP
jgi:hypothetical protein